MPPTSIDLDLFILALVQRGCASAYELKAKAGVSIGSSAPVLERLQKAKLLEKSSSAGLRDRVAYSITNAGKKALRSGWQSLLGTRPTDPDAVLRITYLAWTMGRQEEVAKFIVDAADTLRNAAAIRRAEANQLQATAGDLRPEAFRWLKTRLEAARLDAQGKELMALGEQMKKKKKR